MIVDREQEIDEFLPEEFWDLHADLALKDDKGRPVTLRAKLHSLSGKRASLTSARMADAAAQRILAARMRVKSVARKERSKASAPPFTTSTLQQEASRKLNFSIAKTMQLVQGLYEGVELGKEGSQGLVTYIRTDSVRVSDEAVAASRQVILDGWGEAYLPKKPNVFKGRSGAQDAHEAIRPTEPSRAPDSIRAFLTNDQYRLYKLIYSRFLASQMAPARYDTLNILFEGDRVALRYYGEHRVFPGHAAVYEEGQDEADEAVESKIPALREGDPVTVRQVSKEQRFTQPPARYTEASLVKALEELGIGRPSTYAPTVSTIIGRGYVSREKKRLYPTEMGKMVSGLMTDYFEPIVDTGFTAQMEDQLDEVGAGEKPWQDVLRGFYPSFEGCWTRRRRTSRGSSSRTRSAMCPASSVGP